LGGRKKTRQKKRVLRGKKKNASGKTPEKKLTASGREKKKLLVKKKKKKKLGLAGKGRIYFEEETDLPSTEEKKRRALFSQKEKGAPPSWKEKSV